MHYPIEELHTVIGLWIKAARKTGNPVPKPSNRADVNYSGKFLMRVPKRLHAELAHAAEAQGVSLNQYLLYRLAKGHGERTRRAARTRSSWKRTSPPISRWAPSTGSRTQARSRC